MARILRFGLLALMSVVAYPALLKAQAMSPAEQEVWQGELKYWEFLKTRNIEGYMSLWHDEFIGWPRDSSRPAAKADIRNGVTARLRDTQPSSYTVQLERLSVRVYGDVAVVFYRERSTRLDGAGKLVKSFGRITHTWKKTSDGWIIIGGMGVAESSR